MIYLGLRNTEKQKIVIDYIRQNDIRHVVIFSGEIGGQIGKKSVRAPSRAFHLDIEEIGRNTELEVIPYQYGADAPNSVSDRTIEQFGWAESIMYRVQELRERSDVIYGKAGIYAGKCKGSTVPAA